MNYHRLPFPQYFIDTSNDFTHTGKAARQIDYQAIRYPCQNRLHRLLGLEHEVNFELHYEPERDVIQLNFQKTLGFTDWFANIVEFPADYYDAIEFEGRPLQLRVHRGWGEMYLAAKRAIRVQWLALHEAHPEAETEIIGWSLGSGQAMLCAQDLNYNYGLHPHVYTYGSVKPFRGSKDDAEALGRYLAGLCMECWNFADHNDIVTYMPPFRRWTDLRRVTVHSKKLRIWRLLNPQRYHTCYDDEALYTDFRK
jgi:hypothetical protein